LDPLDHHWLFNAGDDTDGATAYPVDLNVNMKHPFQTLLPAAGR
jgi:hypothetical protein